MFTFNFSSTFVFSAFKTLFERTYRIAQHKSVYLAVYKTSYLINIDLAIQANRDIDIGLGLFGYSIGLEFYDNRAWDYINKRWL
jgi:hypothetical protein